MVSMPRDSSCVLSWSHMPTRHGDGFPAGIVKCWMRSGRLGIRGLWSRLPWSNPLTAPTPAYALQILVLIRIIWWSSPYSKSGRPSKKTGAEAPGHQRGTPRPWDLVGGKEHWIQPGHVFWSDLSMKLYKAGPGISRASEAASSTILAGTPPDACGRTAEGTPFWTNGASPVASSCSIFCIGRDFSHTTGRATARYVDKRILCKLKRIRCDR